MTDNPTAQSPDQAANQAASVESEDVPARADESAGEGGGARPVDIPRVVTSRPVPMPMVTPPRPPVGMPGMRLGEDAKPRTRSGSGSGESAEPSAPTAPTEQDRSASGPGDAPGASHVTAHRDALSASDDQIRDWIDLAVFAVLEASPIALQHFRTGVGVDDKRSHGVFDPVTVADRDVEASIRDFLRRHLPEHRVVGEEHPESPGDQRFTWVIDPIDGTRAFISGIPLWGTLVGLVVDGVAVGGVMHQPFTGETFVADPVRGSVLVHRGTMRRLHTRPVPGGLADAVLYSTHPRQFEVVGATAAFESVADRVRLQRWGGDCYAFAMLAAGGIDLVIEGDLKSYDIAALIPLIEQAGGLVTDLAGNPPANGSELVIASGDPRLHAEVLAIMRAELTTPA